MPVINACIEHAGLECPSHRTGDRMVARTKLMRINEQPEINPAGINRKEKLIWH